MAPSESRPCCNVSRRVLASIILLSVCGSVLLSCLSVHDIDAFAIAAHPAVAAVAADTIAIPSPPPPLPMPHILTKGRPRIANHNVTLNAIECAKGLDIEAIGDTFVCRFKDGSGNWDCPVGWVRGGSRTPFRTEQDVTNIPKPGTRAKRARVDRMACFPGAQRPISDAHKLIFVHVAKAGGSTIERSTLFDDRRQALGGKYLGGHHVAGEYADAPGCEGYHKFSMVRHPCSRLLSLWAYYAQRLGNFDDQEFARTHFTKTLLANLTAFLIHLHRSDANWKWQNHQHFRTQVQTLVTRNGRCGVDQVLVLERWEESMHRLSSMRPGLDMSGLLAAHALPSRHGSCLASYTATAWELMAEMYVMDFCVLGYELLPEAEHQAPAAATLHPELINARLRKCRAEAARAIHGR